MNYEKIIKDNEKLIWKISSHFYGVDKNDLYQAGVLGIIKALKNYNRDGNTKFSSYAYDYIFGEMYTLANNKNIKISKDILKLYKKIELLRYNIAQKINKVPSNYELSCILNVPISMIDLATSCSNDVLSLDYDYNDNSIYDTYGNYENIDDKILLDDGIDTLSDDERKIIKSRYYEDLTQDEVARKLKMTQVKVSRYEKRAKDKLKSYIKG